MSLRPVILCGGAGTRLWPLSRECHPKQLLSFDDAAGSLLQQAALRVDAAGLLPGWQVDRPLVVGKEEYRFLIAEQLRQVGIADATIVLEAVGRDTAPALTLAALAAQGADTRCADPILVVMPSDQVIARGDGFLTALAQALPLAANGRIVSLGVSPTGPVAAYGYIQRGKAIAGSNGFELAHFVEKPEPEAASAYLASGEYFWNSGILVVRASVWLACIERFRADIAGACRKAMASSQRDRDFLRIGAEAMAACPADSIDYAVMENLIAAGPGSEPPPAVIALDAGWTDIGAWDALWDIGGKDADGNVLHGDAIVLSTRNTLVHADSRLVTCIGIDDAVVVETPDAVLVAHRAHLDRVPDLVARLKSEGRSECEAHRKIYRPWGCYDSVDMGARFQVKRIVVTPGASLSLQMHHHRAEHWIVVAGTALVTRGDEQFLLSENESTYIPLGIRHRLANPGKVPLEIIEVQSGSYLGEDDIVRFQDTYGRATGAENVLPLVAARQA